MPAPPSPKQGGWHKRISQFRLYNVRQSYPVGDVAQHIYVVSSWWTPPCMAVTVSWRGEVERYMENLEGCALQSTPIAFSLVLSLTSMEKMNGGNCCVCFLSSNKPGGNGLITSQKKTKMLLWQRWLPTWYSAPFYHLQAVVQHHSNALHSTFVPSYHLVGSELLHHGK